MKDKRNAGVKTGNWYDTMLNGMASAFSKFVAAFKKHGLLFSTFVMVLFVLCYTLIINPIRLDRIVESRLETVYQKEKKADIEAMEKRLKADEIIGGIMTKIVDKFPEVQRVLLLECHNSIKTTMQTDILFITCTMEMLTPNSRHLNYIAEDLQRQIRHNLMGGILNTLKYRDYLYYDDVQHCSHAEHRLLQKLKSVGDNEAILIPYRDDDDVIQMVLVITGDKLPVDDIIDYISTFKKTIDQCLM